MTGRGLEIGGRNGGSSAVERIGGILGWSMAFRPEGRREEKRREEKKLTLEAGEREEGRETAAALTGRTALRREGIMSLGEYSRIVYDAQQWQWRALAVQLRSRRRRARGQTTELRVYRGKEG
jgi:hypothetical protein